MASYFPLFLPALCPLIVTLLFFFLGPSFSSAHYPPSISQILSALWPHIFRYSCSLYSLFFFLNCVPSKGLLYPGLNPSSLTQILSALWPHIFRFSCSLYALLSKP